MARKRQESRFVALEIVTFATAPHDKAYVLVELSGTPTDADEVLRMAKAEAKTAGAIIQVAQFKGKPQRLTETKTVKRSFEPVEAEDEKGQNSEAAQA